MELTKEQRHEIYKLALELHLEDKKRNVFLNGLCSRINIARMLLGIKSGPGTFTAHYPEFFSHRPKVKKILYWWPCDPDDPNRERVLRDCIEKTKP